MALKVKIYSAPSFKVLRPFVLDKAHQLDESRHAFCSPLFSWTAAKLEEALPTIIKDPGLVFNLPGAPTKLNAIKNFDKDGWIKETITMIDRSDIHFKYVPSGLEDMQGRDALALRMCLGSFLCVLFRDHRDYQRLNPGKSIWLLLSTIRVRDIVLYRHFKHALHISEMTNIGLVTDNVMGINRKEATDDPIFAFCAQCSRLNIKHSRCTGCKVSPLSNTA